MNELLGECNLAFLFIYFALATRTPEIDTKRFPSVTVPSASTSLFVHTPHVIVSTCPTWAKNIMQPSIAYSTSYAPSDIFIFLLCISLIIVTTALIFAAYRIIKLVKEVNALVRGVRGEIELLRNKRRDIELNGRTAFKVVKLLAGFLRR